MRRERKLCNLVKLKELLKNPSPDIEVPLYTEEDEDYPVKHSKERITLKEVVNTMNDGFKRMDAKMDAGFKQVNTRIDGLEARMDRIEARMDRIEARLDYNGLKKLPIYNK